MTLKNEVTGIDVANDVCFELDETRNSIVNLLPFIKGHESTIASFITEFKWMEETVDIEYNKITSGEIDNYYNALLYCIDDFIDDLQRFKSTTSYSRKNCQKIITKR